MDNPIADRRQRAREAAQDVAEVSWTEATGVDEAIDVATQVKITDDVVSDALHAVPRAQAFMVEEIQAMIEAAFGAAGFEVVE